MRASMTECVCKTQGWRLGDRETQSGGRGEKQRGVEKQRCREGRHRDTKSWEGRGGGGGWGTGMCRWKSLAGQQGSP